MIGIIIGIAIVVLIIGGCIGAWLYFQTDLFTRHNVTMIVRDTWVDNSKEGSHYMVSEQDQASETKGKIVEILRTFYGWDKNEDRVYAIAKANTGNEVTFSCWGVPYEAFYWYENCDSVVKK